MLSYNQDKVRQKVYRFLVQSPSVLSIQVGKPGLACALFYNIYFKVICGKHSKFFLRVEEKLEFFSWRFGDTDSFGKAGVQDSQSTEKEMEWRHIWLFCRNYTGWKRVNRIRWNKKEMRTKIITLKYLFFPSVFSEKTRSRYWHIQSSSIVFSLKAEIL